VEVYNGVYGGSGAGGFDCQLIVDGTGIIKRGDLNPGQPQAMWYYYGQGGQQLTPPLDQYGLVWYEKNYGISGNAMAGLYLDGNAVTVSNNRFINNLIAVQCDSSNAVIKNNDISSNGSGIICNRMSPKIQYNTISSNGTGIGYYQSRNRRSIITSSLQIRMKALLHWPDPR